MIASPIKSIIRYPKTFVKCFFGGCGFRASGQSVLVEIIQELIILGFLGANNFFACSGVGEICQFCQFAGTDLTICQGWGLKSLCFLILDLSMKLWV